MNQDFDIFEDTSHVPTAEQKVRLSADNFIELARAKWGDLYDYSKVRYTGSHHSVIVVCREHGDFEVTPRGHLDGRKCPLCAEREWRAQRRIMRNLEKAGYNSSQLPTSFVSIDFETLYAERLSACSVGMAKYKDGVLTDRYYTLIRPPFEALSMNGPELTWIHGFTREMVEGERSMEEVMPEMEQFIEGLPLVAHNSCVERACLADTASYYQISTKIDFEHLLDTYPLSRAVELAFGHEHKGPGMYSLDVVCRRFGVDTMHHHNALDDAEMCGNLMLKLIEALSGNIQAPEPVHELIEVEKKQSKYCDEDMIQRTDLEQVADNCFKDKVVVLTGFSTALSQDYGHQLHELGAKVSTGVNKKTNILICGPNAGPSKMAKAQELGCVIMTENEYLSIVNQ